LFPENNGMKRFFLWLVVVGGGILAVALAAALARVAHDHTAMAPWPVMFGVALSYSAIPALAAASRLIRGRAALRILARVILLPMTVTALAVVPPLTVAGMALFQPGWQNLLGALMAAIILAPFAWYYLSLYRRLGRLLAETIARPAQTAGGPGDEKSENY
jgi:hypothetical protein